MLDANLFSTHAAKDAQWLKFGTPGSYTLLAIVMHGQHFPSDIPSLKLTHLLLNGDVFRQGQPFLNLKNFAIASSHR